MLIFDTYSWGLNNILEVVLIPYFGFICSDDDNPNSYEFNPHPYGVVDLDAYYGGNLPDEDLKTIIVVEYYYGRNGKTRSNDNPEGVVGLIYIDAYIAGIEYFSQIIITCEYIDGNVYNHSDFNSLGVV